MIPSFFVEALFPRFCVACTKEGSLMCAPCEDFWTPVPAQVSCAFCGRGTSPRTCHSCREDRYLDGLLFMLPYGNPLLRSLIGSWKFSGDRSAEASLKRVMLKARAWMQPPLAPYVVSWVPLHITRKRQRGFDQGEVMAQWVGSMWGLPLQPLVQRVRRTAPQARMDAKRRQVGEMDDVFALVPQVTLPEYVLLCDDVFTSGTTMDAVARCLKGQGVKTVWGFVLGRGQVS